MTAPKFRVVHLAVVPNSRGQEMREVRMRAIDGEDFVADDNLEDGVSLPSPSGEVTLLVSKSAARKKYALDTVHALEPREE